MRIGFAFCAEGVAHEEIVRFVNAARWVATEVFSGDIEVIVLILSDEPLPTELCAPLVDCLIHARPSLITKPELALLRFGSSCADLDHLVISRFGGRFYPTHLRKLLPHHLHSRAGASIPQYRYQDEESAPATIGDLAHDFECHLLGSCIGRTDKLDLQPDVFLFSRQTVDELLRRQWLSSQTGFALECSAFLLSNDIRVETPTLALSPHDHRPYPYDPRAACERLRLLARKFGGLGKDAMRNRFETFCNLRQRYYQYDLTTRYSEEVLQKV